MRQMIVRTGLLVAALVLGTGVAPAHAAGLIQRDSFSYGGDGIVDFLPCSFPVNEAFEVQGLEIDRFDRAGNFVAATIHLSAEASFTNMDTGYSVRDTDHWTVFVNGSTGSVTLVGLSFHVHVAGKGILVLSAGRMVIDADGQITFLAGPHDQITTNGQALCTALS